MPIYATKCKKCGREAEHILRINDSLPVCNYMDADGPCHGELERIPATSNFAFRGGSPTPRFYR